MPRFRTTRIVLPFALIVRALAEAPSATNPSDFEANRLLDKVAETYRKLHAFRSTALVRTTARSRPAADKSIRLVLAFKRPAMSRVEVAGEAGGAMDYIYIQRGSILWHYMPARNEYCSSGDIRNWQPQQAPFVVTAGHAYEQIKRGLTAATVVARVQLTANSQVFEASVVRALYRPLKSMFGDRPEPVPPNLYWIDPLSGIVLQHSSQVRTFTRTGKREIVTRTISLVSYEADPSLSDRMFLKPEARETTCLALSSGG